MLHHGQTSETMLSERSQMQEPQCMVLFTRDVQKRGIAKAEGSLVVARSKGRNRHERSLWDDGVFSD